MNRRRLPCAPVRPHRTVWPPSWRETFWQYSRNASRVHVRSLQEAGGRRAPASSVTVRFRNGSMMALAGRHHSVLRQRHELSCTGRKSFRSYRSRAMRGSSATNAPWLANVGYSVFRLTRSIGIPAAMPARILSRLSPSGTSSTLIPGNLRWNSSACCWSSATRPAPVPVPPHVSVTPDLSALAGASPPGAPPPGAVHAGSTAAAPAPARRARRDSVQRTVSSVPAPILTSMSASLCPSDRSGPTRAAASQPIGPLVEGLGRAGAA